MIEVIKKIYKKYFIFESSFATDVLKLVGGTTFSQILIVLSSPLLTHLYTPEAFGTFALFLSISNVMSIIACMKYEFSLVIPKSDDEAANLFALSLFLPLLFSIIISPIFCIYSHNITHFFHMQDMNLYLGLVPLAVFINGVYFSLNYWSSRYKQFNRLSSAQIVNSILMVTLQLGVGYLGYSTSGTLIVSLLCGQSIATLFLGRKVWVEDRPLLQGNISVSKIIHLGRTYKKFPLYEAWSSLLNEISWQLPTFLLASFFSNTVVGFYSLGFRILQLPMSLVGRSVSQVFFQRAAEAKNNNTLDSLVENVFNSLVTFGAFPMLMLSVIGGDLFSVIFGEKWAEAGVYVQILSIWGFVWFISSPLSTLWMVLEKQKFGFKITFSNLITRFFSLWIGGISGNVLIALVLFSLSGIFVYGYLCMKLLLDVGVQPSRISNIVISNLIFFIPSGFFIIMLRLLGFSQFILVGTSFILIMLNYFYILKKSSFRSIFLNQNVKKV